MRFIKNEDYDLQIKAEIRNILATDFNDPKLVAAENTAIMQMKHHLANFDVDKIFSGENRDSFIVMTVIDLALYHLYSSKSPNQLPVHRSTRYEDALQWIKGVSRGFIHCSLPKIEGASTNIRVTSHPRQNNRW